MIGNKKEIIKNLFDRNFTKDFGVGFYLVLKKNTPDRTSHNVALRKHFKIRCFYSYSDEWVEFVLNNKFDPSFDHLNELVFGPKLTDISYNIIRKYRNNELDIRHTLNLLKPLDITFQYAYCADSATKPLNILITELTLNNEFFLGNPDNINWSVPSILAPKGIRRTDISEDEFSRRNITELNDIRYIVTLIEALSRRTFNKQSTIVKFLGIDFLREQLSAICINKFIDINEMVSELIEKYDISNGDFIFEEQYSNLPEIHLIADFMAAIIDGIDEIQRGNDYVLMFDFFTSPIFNIIYNYDNDLYFICDKYIISCFKEGQILYHGEKKLLSIEK